MILRPKLLALGAVAIVLAVAACGGSKKTSSSNTTAAAPSGGGETLKLSADPTKLAFNTKTLSAKSGTVTLTMANPSGIPHAIAVEGNGLDKKGQTVQQGGTSTISVNLKPGKYTFYCPVDGHRAAGMEGTLTVS